MQCIVMRVSKDKLTWQCVIPNPVGVRNLYKVNGVQGQKQIPQPKTTSG
jgi:hypothetical protein